MSDPVSIRQAAYDHLAAMPGASNVVWSNTEGAGVPRYEVEPFGQSGLPIFLDMTERHDARLQVTVIVDENTGEADSGPMVQALMQHFAGGTKLGSAEVIQRPIEKQPIQSDGEYRVPVEIRYRAYL